MYYSYYFFHMHLISRNKLKSLPLDTTAWSFFWHWLFSGLEIWSLIWSTYFMSKLVYTHSFSHRLHVLHCGRGLYILHTVVHCLFDKDWLKDLISIIFSVSTFCQLYGVMSSLFLFRICCGWSPQPHHSFVRCGVAASSGCYYGGTIYAPVVLVCVGSPCRVT